MSKSNLLIHSMFLLVNFLKLRRCLQLVHKINSCDYKCLLVTTPTWDPLNHGWKSIISHVFMHTIKTTYSLRSRAKPGRLGAKPSFRPVSRICFNVHSGLFILFDSSHRAIHYFVRLKKKLSLAQSNEIEAGCLWGKVVQTLLYFNLDFQLINTASKNGRKLWM